jgi:hypothetical protein
MSPLVQPEGKELVLVMETLSKTAVLVELECEVAKRPT